VYWSPDLASAHWDGTRLMFDAITDTGVVRYSVAASQLRNVAQRTGAEALSTNLAHLRLALGSGLIGHSQKMTVAASATAENKTVGHRS
jgi:hypothetical protein